MIIYQSSKISTGPLYYSIVDTVSFLTNFDVDVEKGVHI